MNKAKEIYPKSTYITELEYWNGRGYSLFGKDKKKAEEEKQLALKNERETFPVITNKNYSFISTGGINSFFMLI